MPVSFAGTCAAAVSWRRPGKRRRPPASFISRGVERDPRGPTTRPDAPHQRARALAWRELPPWPPGRESKGGSARPASPVVEELHRVAPPCRIWCPATRRPPKSAMDAGGGAAGEDPAARACSAPRAGERTA
jgi:hypothetical protein